MAVADVSRHPAGRIGPNAITRTVEALTSREGAQTARRIFQTAGLERYLAQPPTEMVDELEVARLHQILHDDLGSERSRAIGRRAGQLTAEYLLAHRIPRPAQTLLRYLPSALSSRVLARAIAKNAWTFVGTGNFSARHGRPTVFTITNCPMCRGQRATAPYCDFYAATFERLYCCLVSASARVTEESCQATGARECCFRIDWQET
jgi:divinyl protochlorophyllide a 8-vinyl-reductase